MKKSFVKMFGCVALAVASIVALNACSDDNSAIGSGSDNAGIDGDKISYGPLVDERDGQTYRTTKIGDQVWMAENLNYAYNVPTETLDSSSFCYDNDPANCQKYGRLYLWSAAVDSAALFSTTCKGSGYMKSCVSEVVRGVCPEGWHLPSADEFRSLLRTIELRRTQVITQKKLNAEAITWQDSLGGYLEAVEWNGNGRLDFSALPAGDYYYEILFEEYIYNGLGEYANFWSSTEDGSLSAYFWDVYGGGAHVHYSGKGVGRSVRCLKD